MFPRLNRTILLQILRKSQHQGFALIQYINLFTLTFRKLITLNDTENSHYSTQPEKYQREKSDLPKTRFYIF